MSKKNLEVKTSPAITYPEPIEFDMFGEFLDAVETAIESLEGDGVEFGATDPLEFIKGLNRETAGQNIRWLGDIVDRNINKFASEIENGQPDDGVNLLEDGALPAGGAI